jgi:hypothetical protein
VEIVDADDLVSPCFLESMYDVRACRVFGQSCSPTKKKRMLTDVAGTASDEDTLSKKKSELRYDGGKRSRTLRECFSVEGM